MPVIIIIIISNFSPIQTVAASGDSVVATLLMYYWSASYAAVRFPATMPHVLSDILSAVNRGDFAALVC